jgi:intergrase/recombinase
MARSSHVVYENPYGKFQKHAEQELELLRRERERMVQRTAEIDERERQLREYLKALTPLIAKDPGHVHAEAALPIFAISNYTNLEKLGHRVILEPRGAAA